MLFADFIQRLMPIAQARPEFREHFPPASWKRLFDLADRPTEDHLVFDVDTLDMAELGGGRIEEVVVPFVAALNAEFAGFAESVGSADADVLTDADAQDRGLQRSAAARQIVPAGAPDRPETPGPGSWDPAPQETAAGSSGSGSSGPEFSEEWAFPAYDYSRDDVHPLPSVEIGVLAGDVLQYTWPDPGDGEMFRVTVSDHETPFSPEDATEVARGTAASIRDRTPMAGSIRFVTVWGYAVLDEASRVLGQARKVAEGVYVRPVQDWRLEHDQAAGMIFSSWRQPELPPHIRGRVRVARLPLGEPIGRYLRGQGWLRSEFELPHSGQGFQDAVLVPGEQHTYVAGLEVELSERTMISAHRHLQITPEAVPDRIEDLEVESITRDHQEQLRLTWTQRRGTRVHFCRSVVAPLPEAVSRGRFPAEQLPAANLPPDRFIRNIPSSTGELSDDGRERWVLEGLDWPRGSEWDTLHLTPITEVDADEVLIGIPTQLRRAGRIEGVRLIQRMNWQLVTFTWPGEALAVELRVGFPDSEPDLAAPAHAVVEKTAYERSGGFRLEGGLPPQGCRLFLNAVTHYQGQRIASEPTIAAVEPLWGYQYSIRWGAGRAGGGKLLQRAAGLLRRSIAEIAVDAVVGSCPEEEAPSLVLIHRPDRLPLHASDGSTVTLFAERPGGQGAPQPLRGVRAPIAGRHSLWFDEDEHGPGWYRLLVDARPSATLRVDERRLALERYALADPPLSALDRRG